MRTYLFMLAALILMTASACGGSTPAPAAPRVAAAPTAAPSANPVKAAGEAKIGDRTRCPTSDEEFVVTADSPKVEYNGKTYYFCCSGCDQKFARDPEKYLQRPKPAEGT